MGGAQATSALLFYSRHAFLCAMTQRRVVLWPFWLMEPTQTPAAGD